MSISVIAPTQYVSTIENGGHVLIVGARGASKYYEINNAKDALQIMLLPANAPVEKSTARLHTGGKALVLAKAKDNSWVGQDNEPFVPKAWLGGAVDNLDSELLFIETKAVVTSRFGAEKIVATPKNNSSVKKAASKSGPVTTRKMSPEEKLLAAIETNTKPVVSKTEGIRGPEAVKAFGLLMLSLKK